MSGPALSRREFVATVAGAAGAALVPMPSLVAARPVETAVTGPQLADWTVDDMFGVYPRYAQAIAYGRPGQAIEHGPAEPLHAL